MFKIQVLIFWFVCIFDGQANAQRVSGMVYHQGRDEPMPGAKVSFLASSTVKYQTSTDREGRFLIKKLRVGRYSIKISGFGITDTVFNDVALYGDTSLTIVYSVYCKFDRSAKDKTCPTCGKDDMVIPIRYGLLLAGVQKINRSETSEIQKPETLDYFPGGCVISGCDPNWHCKRDGLDF